MARKILLQSPWQTGFGNYRFIGPKSLAAFAGHCLNRRRQRLDLAALDDAALEDVGLSPEDVRHECAKPFWR